MAITRIDMPLSKNDPGETLNGNVSPELVRAELQAICQSAALGSATRLKILLEYLVAESLAGNPLKESIVGVAVFGRNPDYDPKQDSVVRTEARRLRSKLIEYYAGEGAEDRIVIDMPKGSYAPVFHYRDLTGTLAAQGREPNGIAGQYGGLVSDQGLPGLTGLKGETSGVGLWGVRLGGDRLGRTGLWGVRSRELLAAGMAAALLLLCVAVVLARHEVLKPRGAVAGAPRRSVAVLDFHNLAARPESGWLATAIPEMISADLADGQQVRTIPGENVARMEADLALQAAASPSRETLAAIRRNLGADVVVSGAYADLGADAGGRVRIDIWAEDTRNGDVIASVSENGAGTEVLEVVSRAGARLRRGLGLEKETSGEMALSDVSSRDLGAAREYGDALTLLRRGNLLQARDLLRQCTKADPSFARALATLSSVDAGLGYEVMARDEAKQAFDQSRGMRSEEAKLAIEAQFREANQEPERAAEVYARLFAWHPDDIEYGLQLAAAQRKANKIDDALHTLDGLRKLPGMEASDSRIDMETARAFAARSDYRQSAVYAAEAARKADAANARLLYARALSLESGLEMNLGDEHWRGLSEEARKICEQFQDKACVAAILRRFGNVSVSQLDLSSADRYYSQALGIAHEIGSAAEESNVLHGMAMVSEERGDLKKSVGIQERLLAISRQTQDPRSEQASLASLGDALLGMGEVDAAKEKLEAATKIARTIGPHDALSVDLTSLAELYQVRGDLSLALPICDEALADAREAGVASIQVAVLSRKARILLAKDDLAGARKALDEYDRLSNGGTSALAWLDWPLPALVALAAHQPEQAASLAAEADRQTAAHRLPWQQARAEALLADALLAEGKPAKARAAAGQAWSRLRDSQSRLVRLEVGISFARVTGEKEVLKRIVAEARSIHAYELELEGRLAEADMEHDAAKRASVHADALSHGYLYLARLSGK